jgi:outer membrane protein assembly factor BamB
MLIARILTLWLLCVSTATARESWDQLQGNALRSGNVPEAHLPEQLGLLGAVPLTDGIYSSPVVRDDTVYVVDGSGVVFAIDIDTLALRWKFETRGGPGNCNNVATPAIVGEYLHVGTMAGYYYVLDRETGATWLRNWTVVMRSSRVPAAGEDRVYFATLGASVYAVEPHGDVAWTWDFVSEVVGFPGDRWSGAGLVRAPAGPRDLARPFRLLARNLRDR